MRTLCLLITGFLCLLFSAGTAQAQDLQKKIDLDIERAPLVEVLRKIQESYGVRFSYLNNDLAADTIYNFSSKEKDLSEVLDQLLEKSAAGYQQHNGQIIIKKGLPKKKPVLNSGGEPKEEKQKKKVSGNTSNESENIKALEEDQRTKLVEQKAFPADGDSINKETETLEEEIEEVTIQEKAPRESSTKEELLTASLPSQAENVRKVENQQQKGSAPEKENEKWKLKLPSLNFFKNSSEEKADSDMATFHFGLFYPISNHGTRAPQYVNKVSAHLLVGTAAGLEGVEFSSVGNIEKDYVNGYQFAGVFNVVKNELDGLQFAGFMNSNGGRAKGGQFAGFLNTAGANAEGIQAAGFLNMAGGALEGVQSAGFMNLAGDYVDGVQVAGFMNVAGSKLEGVQAAGFLNKSDSVNGAQLAGFLNSATDVEGVQVSGFLNKARHVKGSQIGIINFADSVSGGVPIGLFSFVKKGYRRFEVYAGEDFEANLNFKIGVRQFHSILALGVELDGNERSGLGFGFGSEWILSQRFHLNTDILSYYVNENSYTNYFNDFFNEQYVNNLNKIRVLASVQLGRRLALFGGPSYNVFVSRYQENPEGPIGSNLVENTFFDRTNRETNVKMWIGFNAGIRF